MMIDKSIKQFKRKAFTMVELVMVIVILGIVSMIATDIISNMYKGYIQTKIVNNLQQKTETLIDQISKRLQYRIKETMIMRNTTSGNFLHIAEDPMGSTYDMVEWIGYDNEGYLGEKGVGDQFSKPGWSGFIDLDSNDTNNTAGTFSTPGSDLNIADRSMKALSNNSVGFTAPQRPALIFKCQKNYINLDAFGWNHANHDNNYTLVVAEHNQTTLKLNLPAQLDANRSICEQYYLAWSAYAIVPEGADSDDFNLTLRYNYQPWYGEKYTDGNSSVLAEHVSTFRVMQVGETLRVKVCIQDGNITGKPVGFCKEKAIF